MSQFRNLVVGVMTLMLCSCQSTRQSKMSNLVSAKPDPTAKSFPIDPRLAWNPTGFQLTKGQTYKLTATIMDGAPYSDKGVPCTPDGPVGFRGWCLDFFARDARCPLNLAHWWGPGKIKRLRVLYDRTNKRASFLTIIGAVEKDDSAENVFVIGKERTVVAHKSGELVVFSNDWPGGEGMTGDERFQNSPSYGNNTGNVLVTVEPK